MDDNAAVFVISVAAELAGMHPQTLRQYDRLGIVSPDRTAGRGRRYSQRDIRRLRTVQSLSKEEGINLEGIKRILALEAELDRVRAENERLRNIADRARAEAETVRRVFAAGASGDVVAMRPGARPRRSPGGVPMISWQPLRAIESRTR